MKNRKLLIYAFLIAGIPSFLLSLLATAYFREFMEDGILEALERHQTFVIDQLSEQKVLARQYLDSVIADEEVMDAFEAQESGALKEMLKPANGVDFLVFVNKDGTFIYPPKTVVSSEQRRLLELGETTKKLKPAMRVDSLVERNGNKIGALETGFNLDRNTLQKFDQETSDVLLAEGAQVLATTMIPSESSGSLESLKVVNRRIVETGGQQFYAQRVHLEDLGLNKGMQIMVLAPQPFILTLLNSFFVLIFCGLIMVPVTFLTWGFFSEMVDEEVQKGIKEFIHDPTTEKYIHLEEEPVTTANAEKKTDL